MNNLCYNCNELFSTKNDCFILKCGHTLCKNCVKNISGNGKCIKCPNCSIISKIEQSIKIKEYSYSNICEKHGEILNIINIINIINY